MTDSQHRRKYGWLSQLGFIPGVEHPESHLAQTANTILVNTPGAPSYIPPLIPGAPTWLEDVQALVTISAQALIADLWTQLLVSKRDYKEKDIYLLWDDEIPKPNPLTALMWLLVCEAWPMPSHKAPMNPFDLEQCFPPQTFLMPQSTPYGFATSRPNGFAEGPSAFASRPLTGLLSTSMHRDDRQRMDKVDEKPVIHRPQSALVTTYQLHTSQASIVNSQWRMNEGWPRLSTKALDQGTCAFEWIESDHHVAALGKLRRHVMAGLLVAPGLPTHRDNLHYHAGGWIRGWSESGIFTKATDHMWWTPEHEPVKLNSGVKLDRIPPHMNPVWFGWTHIGPEYKQDVSGREVRVTSHSEHWAKAYRENRKHALNMLFKPSECDIESLIAQHTRDRAEILSNAGRLTKPESATANTSAKDAFANAFAAVMGNKESK
jgi:hypothetical protein